MDNSPMNTYWLDDIGTIVQLGSSWDQFLQDNGGSGCSSCEVLGKSIWGFIHDDPTRMWLDTLITLAKLQKKPVERPYRCDSPHIRRFMRMHIVPEDSRLIRIEHIILKEEARVSRAEMYGAHDRAATYCRRCSVCCRVDIDGEWTEPDIPLESINDDPSGRLRVTYTVCEDCRQLLSKGEYRLV